MIQVMPKASPFAAKEGSGEAGLLQHGDILEGDEEENWGRVNHLLGTVEELELTWDKTWATLVNDHQALADARDGARRDAGSAETLERLDRLAELWHRFALVGGVLALVLLPRARRAWPLWSSAGLMVVAV